MYNNLSWMWFYDHLLVKLHFEYTRPVEQIVILSAWVQRKIIIDLFGHGNCLSKLIKTRFGAFVFQMQIDYSMIGEFNILPVGFILKYGSFYANARCVNRLSSQYTLLI